MLTADQLQELEQISGRLIVAYSGGCDSHALLHYLHTHLERSVEAVHINHGLSPHADAWQGHCEQICDDMSLPLSSYVVEVATTGSLETNARSARYSVFDLIVEAQDVLLLAHHADDQTETLLLNLLSGRAPMGLLGIPATRPVGRGMLVRPLLQLSRSEIEHYARRHDLRWIDDPSNLELVHRRNYLRHEVIPGLRLHWPELDQSMQRSWDETRHLIDNLESQARTDCDAAFIARGLFDAVALEQLDSPRRMACLRELLQRSGYPKEPGRRLLKEIQDVLLPVSAQPDTAVEDMKIDKGFDLGAFYLQRYRNQIFIYLSALAETEAFDVVDGMRFSGGKMTTDIVKGQGCSLPANQMVVRPRRGGEKILVRGKHHSIKKLFQEMNCPPDIRPRIPLVFLDDECIGIASIPVWGIRGIVSDAYRVANDEFGCEIGWTPW